MAEAQIFTGSNGKLQFRIILIETDIITSGADRGNSKIQWTIQARGINAGDGINRYEGNRLTFTLNGNPISSITDDNTTVYIPTGTYTTITSGTAAGKSSGVTSSYYTRNNTGFLDPVTVYMTYRNSLSNSASTTTTVTGTYTGSYWAMYTACTNPTTKTFSPFSEPGSSSTHKTISWSGATGGVSNPITKYALYGRFTSNGAAPTETSTYLIDGNISPETDEYVIPQFAEKYINRGYKLVLYIKTIGTQEGFDAPFEYFGTIQINRLPATPTISRTWVGLSSTPNSTYRLTVSPGSDADGQQTQVYYSTDNNTYILLNTNYIDVGASTAQNSTTIYYFKTYDGLEYNTTPAQCTVYRNADFTLENNNTTYEKYKAQGESSANYTNIINLILKKKRNDQSPVGSTYSSSDILSIYLKYRTNSSGSYSTYKLNDFIFPSNGSFSRTYNIDRIIAQQNLFNNNNNFEYYLYYECVESYIDGEEDVATGTVGLNGTTPLKIAKSPTSIITYNNLDSDSNISGTNNKDIWDRIRIKFYTDNSVPNISVQAESGGNSLNIQSLQTSYSQQYTILKVILENKAIEPGENINFTINLNSSNSSLTKSFSITDIKEVKFPVTPNSWDFMPSTTYNVFSNNGTVSAAYTWPFESTYAQYDSELATNYAIGANSFTCSFTYNGITSTGQAGTPTRSGDNLNLSFSDTNIRTSILNAFSVSSGSVQMTLNLNFTNLFGKTITYTKTKNVNFTQNPTTTSSSLSVLYNGSAPAKLQETMTLDFKLANVTIFTGETLQIKIYKKLGTGSYSLLTQKSQTFTRSDSYNGTQNEYISVSYTVGEISDSSQRKFKIEILRGNTVLITKESSSFNVVKHVAPTASGIQTSYSNGILTLSFTPTLGYDNIYTSSWKLIDQNSNEFTLSPVTGGSVNTFNLSVSSKWTSSWDYKSVYIYAVTTQNNPLTVTKTLRTSNFLVYNIVPTISYRKNKLGINTSTIQSGTVLELHTNANDKNVILKDVSDELTSTVIVNLSSLMLDITSVGSSTSRSNAIDLMNLGQKITSSATTATAYLFAGTCTTGAQNIYTNASCYMSNGHLYSNTKQVASINTAAQTAASQYYLKGSSTQNGVELQTHASCYMSGGYLYSGGTKVDMGELYKLNPTTNANKRYLTAVSNTTGIQLVNTNVNCYMSGGYLYSNGTKVDMGELYKLSPTVTTSSVYIPGVLNTTGAQVVYTNTSCYMSNGHLYSNAQQVASISTAAQGSTTSYYIKGSSTGDGSELYSNANCYMLNNKLYSNGYKTLTECDVFPVPLYLNLSGHSSVYFGGILNFYTTSTSSRIVQLFYNSRLQGTTLPSGTFNVVYPGTTTAVVLPSGLAPSQDTAIISGLSLYRITGNKPEWTSSSKITITVTSNGNLLFTMPATLGVDDWERQYIATY